MNYATPAELLTWFGAKELAEIAAPDDLGVLVPELLRLTISSGDRMAYTLEECRIADEAVQRLETAIADASRLMDSYLAQRYVLPLATEIVAASALPRTCGVVARFCLYDDVTPPETASRYDRAIQWLRDLANGKADLGGGSAPTGSGVGMPDYYAAPKYFDENALRGFM